MSFGFGFGFPKRVGAALRATVAFDFLSGVLDPSITFFRSTTGTYFNSAGILSSAAINTPRFDYDPVTLAPRGLLIEGQRTNSIRNNTMQNAVAGTPGTMPTGWSTFTTLTGLTRQIVGTGTENGITYIDIRLSGTPSGAGSYILFTEANTTVAALNGQTWTNSAYFKLQAGSLTGISSVRLYFQENNNLGNYLTEQSTAITPPTTAALATQRAFASRTLNQATTAFLSPGFVLVLSGAAIDITLRIGMPQLEQGAFATSVISTTTAAATRTADVATLTGANFSNWYNQSEGTFYTESQILYNSTGLAPFVFSANDGTAANQIVAYYNATNKQNFYVRAGGIVTVDTGATATANAVFRFAGAYKTDDCATTTNGATVIVDTSATLPTTLNRLDIGSFLGASGHLNGYIRRIVYYNTRLSDATLRVLTQ